MKFKHTINVLIDNFKVTYKLLIYLLIVAAVSIGISAAIIVPFINSLSDVSAYNQLMTAFGDMFDEIIQGNLNNLSTSFSDIGESFSALMEYLSEHPGDLALSITGLLVVALIRRFFVGLGNYTAGSLINDKMAMQANSPFAATLIKISARPACIRLPICQSASFTTPRAWWCSTSCSSSRSAPCQ